MDDLDAALFLMNTIRTVHFDALNNYSSSSSEDEDEEENDEMIMRQGRIARDGQPVVRIEGYLEDVIPNYRADQFQQHFRLTVQAYDALEREIAPLLPQEQDHGLLIRRPPLTVRNQLLPVLWLLATPDSYRSVGDRFGMSKSSLFRSFENIVTALNKLAPRAIPWPSQEKRAVIKERFERIGGMPNIIGAIDGTYIKIKAPKENPENYVTRKCCYAFTAQAISDSDLRFLDVFVGFPGSVSDTRIFRNSHIFQDVTANKDAFFNHGEYIIGDKAYPNLDWCIAPYIDRGNLTPAQRYFNRIHAKHRQVIERAWALLFSRFRRLKFLDMNRTDLIPATILACCVLHNICLDHDSSLMPENNNGFDQLLGPDEDLEEFVFDGDDAAGSEYRDELCEMMNMRRVNNAGAEGH